MECKEIPFFICPPGSRHRVLWREYNGTLVGYCEDCFTNFEMDIDQDLINVTLTFFKLIRSVNQDIESLVLSKFSFFKKILSKHKVKIKDIILDKYIFPESSNKHDLNIEVDPITLETITNYMFKTYADNTNFDAIILWLEIVSSTVESNIPKKAKELLTIIAGIDPKFTVDILDIFDYLIKIQDISTHKIQILEILHKINKYIEDKLESYNDPSNNEDVEDLFNKLKDTVAINIALNKANSMGI